MYKKLMVISPFILLVIFGAALYFDTIASAENFFYDNVLQSERAPDSKILIIGMDERSLDEIGTWPWPRYFVADAVKKLIDNNAAAVGVDVLYDNYGSSEEYDKTLVEVGKSDRVVFASLAVFEEGQTVHDELYAIDYITPFEELNDVAKTAFLNVFPDPQDGIIRKALSYLGFGDAKMTSFPIEVYKTYCDSRGINENLDIPSDRFGRYYIDYVAEANSYTMLSLWGVINDEYPAEIYNGAIALIGPYAVGIGNDSYFTPVDHGEKTYGVEIHANILQNLLESNFKREADLIWSLAILCVFAVASATFFDRLKPLGRVLAVFLLIIMQVLLAKILYVRFDLIIISSYTIMFLITAYLFNLVLSLLDTQREKARIHGLFGRFVSADVVREIIAGNVSVELGGVLRDVTVLFVDIRGFTAFSEANPPEIVVEMVNRYLDLTSRSIQQNKGTIDKYIGDATMAVFNAPGDLENHTLYAVKAAWAMKKGSEALRDEILRDFGVDLQFGIGVNCGQAVVGNMGSEFRMDYTVIGDTVNTAARLESNAQKGQIIISEAVYERVREQIEALDLDYITVKNKKDGIHIYEVTGLIE